MGRDRKLIGINGHHFTKAEIEERMQAESLYQLNRDELKPFDYLSEEARIEFERIKNNAFWLDNLDRTDLNLYCFYFERITAILREYNKRNEDGELEIPPEVIEMQSEGGTKLVANPLRKALNDYHSEIRKLSAKLGIAKIDRLKLATPLNTKKNKFEKYFMR